MIILFYICQTTKTGQGFQEAATWIPIVQLLFAQFVQTENINCIKESFSIKKLVNRCKD